MKKEKRKTGKNIKLALIASLLTVAALAAVTAAKYIGKVSENHLQTDTDFCFSSNLLNMNPQTINLYGRNTAEDYTFQFKLRNWDNRLNISNVNYTANITSDNSNVELSKNSVSFNNAGTLTSETITVTIPAGVVLTDDNLTVNAAVSTPYSKAIYAQFHISQASQSSSSMIKNFGEYVEVHCDVVVGKTYTFVWPQGYSPDNTNALFENAVNSSSLGGGTYTVAAQAEDGFITVRFFKIGTVPDQAAISITKQGGTTVTELIPSV